MERGFPVSNSSTLRVLDHTGRYGRQSDKQHCKTHHILQCHGPTEPDTEFERSVGRIVQSLGFDVHFQIGTMGFFIDLAIPDPASSARYLCGIECDGAPYHSHPTARDRDRFREEILRARGWDIYRIWSTDWYRNRETEFERLRGYLRQKAGIGATGASERTIQRRVFDKWPRPLRTSLKANTKMTGNSLARARVFL